MLAWFAETTVMAGALAVVALAAGRAFRLGPAARHVLWVVVLVKLLSPPLLRWPWALGLGALTSHAPEARSELPDDFKLALSPTADETPLDVSFIEDRALAAAALRANDFERADAAGSFVEFTEGAAPVVAASGFDTRWIVGFWAAGSALVVVGQVWRIVRFARRVKGATDAPVWLLDELDVVAERIGTLAPGVRVVSGGGSPMLWCLTRPMLVVPARVLEGLDKAAWRGILAHELAHLKRGDAWVCRLSLVAAAIWWWNPVYWLAARRLEHESELACDAWAVAACGEARRRYAETLVEVCSLMSVRGAAGRDVMPALGIGTAADGRFLERRLTMILKGGVMKPESLAVKLGAAVLLLLSTPMWSVGQSAPVDDETPKAEKPVPPVPPVPPLPPEIGDEPEEAEAPRAREARRPQAPGREAEEIEAARQTAERAMQEAMRMRELAEARAQEAQARFQAIQRRLQERVAIQDHAEQNTREAQQHAEEAIAKAAEEAAAAGGTAEEIRERLIERTRGAREALRAAQVRTRENLVRDRERARGDLERATAEAAEVDARNAVEARAPRAPAAPARVRERLAPLQAPARIVERRAPDASVERLERRIDDLERKLDALVEELRAQRNAREGGGR